MHMANRTARFASAIFASLLAGITLSNGAARAADDCLSEPKGETPPGGHWHYRIDHANKRQCWYLKVEDQKLSRTAQPNSPPSAKPIAPKAEVPMQHSIADAHAELAAQIPLEPPKRNAAPASAIPADTAARETDAVASTPDTTTQQSIVASRWFDPSTANPSANPASDSSDPVTDANTDTNPTPPTPSVLAAGQYAAADMSPQAPAYSVPIKLAALIGALALAGILASVVFKFGSARRPARARMRKHRGAIWELSDEDRVLLSAQPRPNGRPGFARDLDRADDPSERIEEFIAQLARRTRT